MRGSFPLDFASCPADPDMTPERAAVDLATYKGEVATQTAARATAWGLKEAARIARHLIVSRHPATVEFLRRELGAKVQVISGDATPDDVRGRIVAGNIPLCLAAVAAEILSVEFTRTPPRGREYNAADMVAAGAELRRYTVSALGIKAW